MAEEDGGRLIGMTLTSGPYQLEYQAAYWHGNDGVIQRVSALGERCGNDEELDRHLIYQVSEIRRRLKAALALCAAPPRAVRTALRGLEPAYALAMARDWERAVAEASTTEVPMIYGPEDAAHVLCDGAGGVAERDITEMNATEAAQAATC